MLTVSQDAIIKQMWLYPEVMIVQTLAGSGLNSDGLINSRHTRRI